MRILGVDSSGMVASVALVEDDLLVAEYSVNYKKTHSQTLLPMLDEIVKMTELDLNTIDAIAVAAGPGSFTGLRIGAATAKRIALVLDKPILPVPTVDSLAFNLFGTQDLVCPIMDARRHQVYTGIYEEREAGSPSGAVCGFCGGACTGSERTGKRGDFPRGRGSGLSERTGRASEGTAPLCTGASCHAARSVNGCSC